MVSAEELVEAQERVGSALSRARVAEDRLIAGKIREYGEQMVRTLIGLVRLRRIHSSENEAFRGPSRELAAGIERLHELLGVVEIVASEGQVYVNDVRAKFTTDVDAGAELGRMFLRHDIATIALRAPLTPEQARSLTMLLASESTERDARAKLRAALKQAKIPGVKLTAPVRARYAGDMSAMNGAELSQAYERSIDVLTAVWSHADTKAGMRPIRLRRMISDLTGLELQAQLHHYSFAGKDMRSSAFARHSHAVSSLAVALGRAAGLAPDALSDLGLAALYHDLGYVSAAEQEGGSLHEAHGVEGAIRMLRDPGLGTPKLRRVLTCLHHHEPSSSPSRPPLFARIVKLVDDYEHMTTIRGTLGRSATPPDAMRHVQAAAGSLYDPVLVKLFVNMMGAFPPGTVLELDDRRWVVSISGARSRETFDRPLASPMSRGPRDKVNELEVIDLADYTGKLKVLG